MRTRYGRRYGHKHNTRSCTKKTLEDSEDVIKEIERFIEEGDSGMTSLTLKKGRIFDTNIDLLQLLGSDIDPKKNKKIAHVKIKSVVAAAKKIPEKSKIHQNGAVKAKIAEPSRKRRSEEEETAKPKVIKVVPTKDDAKKKRGRPKKVNSGAIVHIDRKYDTCKEFASPKTRNCRMVLQIRHTHRPKVWVPIVLEDSVTVSNITIKPEVVDLTLEETEVRISDLKFAEQRSFEVGQTFGSEARNATAAVEPHRLATATVHTPHVGYHCGAADSVDLTLDDADTPVLISEKECANKLVAMVLKCHRIHLISKKMEDALQELEMCVPKENSMEAYESVYNLISKHATSWSVDLLRVLSGILVRNLNITRFLDIVASKLSSQHQLVLRPNAIACYLMTLLKNNTEALLDGFAADLLKQLDGYFQMVFLKQEREVVDLFTEEQLEELRWQIRQYSALAARQAELMAFQNSFSQMDREMKEELLTRQEGAVNTHL